ncbi:MAG: sulfatase [Verrucomicrobiota bacterium]
MIEKLSCLIVFSFTLIGGLGIAAADHPNILWIVSEDNSISWVSCYGSKNAETPNIDQLAKEGFRYTHCFDNAAVCAPTRSTWITGHYAISIGTQPMRSRYDIPHDRVPYYPDLLQAAGYYVENGGKTDYNIGSREDKDTWLGPDGQRPKRGDGQPFFVISNIGESHESRAFPRSPEIHTDPTTMVPHSYHPDLPEVRNTYARYADAIGRMDKRVGEVIAKLKADGNYEDTIIVYCSDHGGVLARSKRFLYSSGIHCPLIVRIPEKWKDWWPAEKPGMTVDRIVSFVDMPKTWLSLAGAEVPDSYQGRIFLGPDIEPAPSYHLSFRERADEACDSVRGMRDERFAYIKNYMPWAPNGQKLQYMYTMEATRAWFRHHQAGKTDEVTGRFFRPRESEEFYDTVADFDNITNLIRSEDHQEKIEELRSALRAKQLELFDSGLLPEEMRLRRAKENGLTIYEMVRDPELYPLAEYLDLSDMALARETKHLDHFVAALDSIDEGLRYWAICGLFLLDSAAAPAIESIKEALADEAGEVAMMAAWTIDKLGQHEEADAALEKLRWHERSDPRLYDCLLRWMGREIWDPEAPPKPKSRPSKPQTPVEGLITDWLITGPFPGDKSHGMVEHFAPALEAETEWVEITKGIEPSRIDLQATLGEHDNCSAFLKTTVYSPKDQSVTLLLRCDDIASALLNGALVEGDRVTLREGENELIVKAIDHKKGWRLTCAFQEKGAPVPGLTFEAK